MAIFSRIAATVFLSALGAAATPPTAEWLPDGAVYTLQITQPSALLDLALDLQLSALAGGSNDQGLQMVTRALAQRAGTNVQGLIRNLTSGGVTYAMYPGENSVWILDAKDGLVLDALQQFVKTMAGTHLALPASTKPATLFYQEHPGGVVSWTFDGKQFFARTGNRLLLASRGELLKALFTPHSQSLASSPLYTHARQAAGDGPAWAFVNMAMLNKFPPAQKGLEFGYEPFSVILNGAWKQSLRNANWLAAGIKLDGKQVHLQLVTDAKLTPTLAGAFTLPGPAGVLPNLAVPRELAAVTLWRDLGKFYSEKEALFPLKTSYGILAENFLEIFFTGRDLGSDVFARFHPQIRLVVARQRYDPAIGTPEEQYPAAAVVFRIDHSGESPMEFGEILEEAWQKAVGLNSFIRGQSALPGLILDRETYSGVNFTYGAFSARGESDRAHMPVRFNVRPAIVRTGPYIILSTTDGLARDLIDAVHREDGRTPPATTSANTVIEIDHPAEISALLQADKAAMVRQSVLSGGKKPDQAAMDIDDNLALLDKFVRAKLSVYTDRLDLDLELK